MKSVLIRKKFFENCPLCGKDHEVEERKKIAYVTIKNDKISYEEKYYFCSNAKNEQEFEIGPMINENLLNAKNAYRKKHNLLTSNEIIDIRKKYNLSQVDFSRLLGLGDVTITRYETKAIQDETYDSILRRFKNDPLFVLELLKKNGDKLPIDKIRDIKEVIISQKQELEENKVRNNLKSDYTNFCIPSKLNGFTTLNIDKIEAAASYIAEHVSNLFKVKLMKMLWYTDNLSYKKYQHSITGMVYTHENMGALPVGHRDLMMLPGLNVVEEMSANYDSMFHVYPNPDINYDVLTSSDKEILDAVIKKFKNFSTKEIVEYMHEETAYTKTVTGEAISFDFANEIRPF